MPPQIDFYVLDQAALDARLDFCQRLIGKILSRKQLCSVLVEDSSAAQHVDEYLWREPPESFVPHRLANNEDSPTDLVTIIASDLAPPDRVCINLRQNAPSNHSELQRLVEIVCQAPEVLATTRDKYRFYRQLSYPLQSHPIKTDAQ